MLSINNSHIAKSASGGGKILITGGAGFIGSHLVDHFIKAGDEVVVIDNFLSGSKANIAHHLDNPRFTLIEHDLTTPLNTKLTDLASIFHFASPASPNPKSNTSYMAHPIETLMVNSFGTREMLELATANNCPIILASTSEVYGDPTVHPQPETYWGNVSCNGPRSCYDEGKRFLEAISFAYHRTHHTKIKVIRIFNTYGPRMLLNEGRLIPALVDSALNGTTFYQHGDGSASRSFCYIDDLVRGILAVNSCDQAVGEVINLGNPEEYSIIETIKVLEDLVGSKLPVEVVDPLPDDPKRRKPDITKAKKVLSWEPTISLRDGLSSMINSYGKK